MTNIERIKQKLDELGRDEITHSEVRELVENYERAVSALFLIECMANDEAEYTASFEARKTLKELGEL